MHELLNFVIWEISEDNTYNRRMWPKICQFSYQDIRIINNFCKLEKILDMPMDNFNVSFVKEPHQAYDGDSQN